jgi:hypothetical protein
VSTASEVAVDAARSSSVPRGTVFHRLDPHQAGNRRLDQHFDPTPTGAHNAVRGAGRTVQAMNSNQFSRFDTFEAILENQSEVCDRVVCFDGQRWWLIVHAETGQVEEVTYVFDGKSHTFTRPERLAVRGEEFEHLADLAEAVVEGGVAGWRSRRRTADVNKRRRATRRAAKLSGESRSHLPAEDPGTSVLLPAGVDVDASLLTVIDERFDEPVEHHLILDTASLQAQVPNLVERRVVHMGVHYATGQIWADATVYLHLDRILNNLLGTDPLPAWAEPDILVGLDGHYFGPLWLFNAQPVASRSYGTDRDDDEGVDPFDDAALVAEVRTMLQRFARRCAHTVAVRPAPNLERAPEELIALLSSRGWGVGFGISFIATGEYGPSVYGIDGAGREQVQLGIGHTWAEALHQAIERAKRLLDLP